MKRAILTAAGSLLFAAANAADERPNVLIILADDLGFSDIGCYGGEIETPNLNRMADEGLRMTQMYNASRSCPSRANLLTGLYPQQTGMGHMVANNPKWPKGYSGFRSNSDNVTIAEVMKQAGYFTAMVGKWHLGPVANPVDRGFEEYYGMLGGFNSCWSQKPYSRLPKNRTPRVYNDGEFYSTNAFTDYALDFIDQSNEVDKPLFMYLAYNAPHFPLHAPKDKIDKYMKTYLKGWDVIRDERWQRIVDMNLLQGKPQLSPRGVVPQSLFMDETYPLPAWDTLTKEQQTDLARRMSTFAAMVDVMDENIGRIIDKLEQTGELDNTFILFISDNGACAEWHEFGFDGKTGTDYHIHTGEELERMGQPESYIHYGTGWANVCCTPFTNYKHYSHEGGISTPCIIRWGDNVKHKGGIDYQPAQFSDVMSTCIELAQTEYPAEYQGREITPTPGISIIPIVKGKKLKKRYIYNEHEGNRMIRYGDWKVVAANFRGDKWELYNIKKDRTEQHDLAAKYPKRVEKMVDEYFKWADRSDVLYFPKVWNTYQKKYFPVHSER